jgi:Transposase, Mutator family
LEEVKARLAQDQDFLRPLVQAVLQELLEAEMSEAPGAAEGERTPHRLGCRAGYYGRTLITRVGKLELRVPQDRAGRFSTELFERYQRSEKALVAALAEMYVQGVSTRKVITEELCGHSFMAAAISAINAKLDEELAQFAGRRLDDACPYLIVDARYERIRDAGVIGNQAVLLAIGIGWDGRRSILGLPRADAVALWVLATQDQNSQRGQLAFIEPGRPTALGPPSALKRITQSRSVCRSIPACRAACSRLMPASTLEGEQPAGHPAVGLSRRANRRSSPAGISVRIGTGAPSLHLAASTRSKENHKLRWSNIAGRYNSQRETGKERKQPQTGQ